MTAPTHEHPSRQFYGRNKVHTVAGEAKDCLECRSKDWVVQLLQQYAVPAGSNVCMASIGELADTLIEELCLTEWFETWDDPPEYVK